MWRGFKEFFTYTRSQRNGLLVLLVLAVLIQLLLYFEGWLPTYAPPDTSEFEAMAEQYQRRDSLAQNRASRNPEPFAFNPNEASDSVLQAVGFPPWLAQRLISYRQSGGHFREAQDLARLYGIDTTLVNRLVPYVRIPQPKPIAEDDKSPFKFKEFDLNQVARDELVEMGLYEWQAERIITFRTKVRPYQKPIDLYQVYHLDTFIVDKMLPYARVDSVHPALKDSLPAEEKPTMVNINTADSLALLELAGVGPFYCKMIRQYRQSLGGFYRQEQLLEVYGMDEQRLEQFAGQLIFEKGSIRKLNVNKATFKALVHHPYLEYEVVRNIVNFRENQRPFKGLEELKQLELIDEQLFQ
ncbi:MAG: helix-hairpin-helix domain-containing protein [Owenweeksia sp.]|nr:helix-hairpin-helix domain-containing protein [Owenweeksia sp.]